MACYCGYIPFVRVEIDACDQGASTPDAIGRVYKTRAEAIRAAEEFAKKPWPDGFRILGCGGRFYKCSECKGGDEW